MAKPKRTAWDEAKTKYVTNPQLTHEDIAEKYDVSLSMVKRKASEGNWTEERTKHSLRVYEETLEKLATEGAKNRADIIKMALYVMAESFKFIKETSLKPKDHRDAVDAMKKMADTIEKFLPTRLAFSTPSGDDEGKLPEEFEKWYITVAKEFAPELLNGKKS